MAKKSIAAILSATATETKKKSDIPLIPGAEKLSDEVVHLKVVAQDAEAAFRVKEAELIEIAQAKYEELAEQGDFTKSIEFSGAKTPGVQVSYTDRFSAIPMDQADELRKEDPEFDHHFEEKREIALKITDDKSVELLIAKLGEKLFAELFEVKLSIVAKADMDRKQFGLGKKIRAFLKQAKPSVKIKK